MRLHGVGRWWITLDALADLSCLILHTFPCSVWLCMPCPELLAQDAAVYHRKLPVFTLSCLSSKSQPFHSEPQKILDSSQWTRHFSWVFSGRKKSVPTGHTGHLKIWSALSSLGHLGIHQSTLASPPGRMAGTYPPGSEFWEERPPRNRDFQVFF